MKDYPLIQQLHSHSDKCDNSHKEHSPLFQKNAMSNGMQVYVIPMVQRAME